MNTTATPAPARERNFSPSEFSAALAKRGIGMCTDVVRSRCALPSDDPRHIRTIKALHPRYYIPESEFDRILQ